ncbi:MAG: HlyD family secretion protein [Planctomycetota bacterium]
MNVASDRNASGSSNPGRGGAAPPPASREQQSIRHHGDILPPPGIRRRLPSIIAPIVVVLIIGAVLFWTAGESLRPVRQVEVVPALAAPEYIAARGDSTKLPSMAGGAMDSAGRDFSFAENTEASNHLPVSIAPFPQARMRNISSETMSRAGNQPDVASRGATSAPTIRDGRTVQAAGWLEAEPHHIACSALVGGIIDTISVLEGDAVDKGEVVAALIRDELEIAVADARAQLSAAEADIEHARARLEAALRRWEHPVERTRAVETTAARLAETEAEVARLPSEIAAAEARLNRLSEELVRARDAASRSAANEFEVVILEQDVAAQQAEVKSLEGRRAVLLAQRDRLKAEHDAAVQNAELRIEEAREVATTRAYLTLSQAARSRANQTLRLAELNLDRASIRAPISGIVQRRLKVPGDKVTVEGDDPTSAQILYLYDPAHMQVRVDVPLADAAQVFVGQACEVSVEVLPDLTFDGIVSRVTHEADLQKNTLQVKVRVTDPHPLMRPEMLSRVRFLPEFHESAGTDLQVGFQDSWSNRGQSRAEPEGDEAALVSGNGAVPTSRSQAETADGKRRGFGTLPQAPDTVIAETHDVLVRADSLRSDETAPEAGTGPGASGTVWVVRERKLSRGKSVPVRVTIVSASPAIEVGEDRDVLTTDASRLSSNDAWVHVRGRIRPGELVIVGDTSGLRSGEAVRFASDSATDGVTRLNPERVRDMSLQTIAYADDRHVRRDGGAR